MNRILAVPVLCAAFLNFFANSDKTIDVVSGGGGGGGGPRPDSNATELTTDDVYVQEFLPSIFTEEQLKRGAVVFYFIGALYSFGIIGIVCGDYFLPSIDCICTDLKLSQDVAAATFMSFATTAPELFIILIATFITKSDIGVGAVIGSGMFNILGVATIGGLAARAPIKLDWWPLYRDSLVYMFAPIALAVIVSDGQVTLLESIFLIAYYFFYFVVMLFNRRIRKMIKYWLKKIKKENVKGDNLPANIATSKMTSNIPTISLTLDETKANDVALAQGNTKDDEDDRSFKAYFINYEDSTSLRRVSACSSVSNRSRKKSDRSINFRASTPTPGDSNQAQLMENLNFVSPKLSEPFDQNKADGKCSNVESCPEEEKEDMVRTELFTFPRGTLWNKLMWVYLWPASFVLYCTVPYCKSDKWRKFYPVTFFMCTFWIGLSSYFGTWMITVLGETIGITDSVMGLTFLALGGSMPEAISTFIMSRQGEGGLGFSNSLGGNTMDICLCLGLPWLLKCFVEGRVPIQSEGLQHNSAALVIGIIVLLSVATHTKFHMNRKMGFICCIFYLVFIVTSLLIEMNIIVINTNS